jgi:hypothetical protein
VQPGNFEAGDYLLDRLPVERENHDLNNGISDIQDTVQSDFNRPDMQRFHETDRHVDDKNQQAESDAEDDGRPEDLPSSTCRVVYASGRLFLRTEIKPIIVARKNIFV